MGLTHLDASGEAHMVDVGSKRATARHAVARGRLVAGEATISAALEGSVPKGDVLAIARVAGIMAAKRTSELIPLCHPLPLTHLRIGIVPGDDGRSLVVEARAETTAQTGVEMEALTAASVTLLTLYDMLKSMERGMTIESLRLEEKAGGRTGHWQREAGPSDPSERSDG